MNYSTGHTSVQRAHPGAVSWIIYQQFITWYGNMGTKDKNAVDKTVEVPSKINGLQFSSLNRVYNKQVLTKASSIQAQSFRPLNSKYMLLSSGLRLCASITGL